MKPWRWVRDIHGDKPITPPLVVESNGKTEACMRSISVLLVFIPVIYFLRNFTIVFIDAFSAALESLCDQGTWVVLHAPPSGAFF